MLAVVGATGGLICISYLLARGRVVSGGEWADRGAMAARAGAVATFLAASVALLVAAGFRLLGGPRLPITQQGGRQAMTSPQGLVVPWVRTASKMEVPV